MRMSIAAGPAVLLLCTTASAPARFHISAPETASRQCIGLHGIRDESAEDDGHLLFHVGGGRVFRNALPKPCDDLRSINSLARLRLHPKADGELCQGDKVTVSGTDVLGAVGVGNGDDGERTCTLGSFEGTSEMSLTEELRR